MLTGFLLHNNIYFSVPQEVFCLSILASNPKLTLLVRILHILQIAQSKFNLKQKRFLLIQRIKCHSLLLLITGWMWYRKLRHVITRTPSLMQVSLRQFIINSYYQFPLSLKFLRCKGSKSLTRKMLRKNSIIYQKLLFNAFCYMVTHTET